MIHTTQTVITRIRLLGILTIVALFSMTGGSPVWAGPTELEIFFLPHQPAVKVADLVEKIARQYPDVRIHRYNFDDEASQELVQKYNLTGHLPVAIFINGKNRFTVNGQTIKLRNFPKSDTFIPSFGGEWDYPDLKAVLSRAVK